MKYIQYQVPKELKYVVRYFWSYDSITSPTDKLTIKSFADKYPRFIFQDNDNYEPIIAENQIMPCCYISGIDTKPSESNWYNSFSHFGASFYPHALFLIWGINASELVDKMPNLLEIEITNIPEKLKKAKCHKERVAIMAAYFLEKIQHNKKDMLIHEFVFSNQMIYSNADLFSFLKKNTISERQFQRKFKIQTGITFKNFNRLSTFEQVLENIPKLSNSNLTQLSYDFGYTDQSHFIKTFKEFSGATPLQFIKINKLGNESNSFIYESE